MSHLVTKGPSLSECFTWWQWGLLYQNVLPGDNGAFFIRMSYMVTVGRSLLITWLHWSLAYKSIVLPRWNGSVSRVLSIGNVSDFRSGIGTSLSSLEGFFRIPTRFSESESFAGVSRFSTFSGWVRECALFDFSFVSSFSGVTSCSLVAFLSPPSVDLRLHFTVRSC